MCVLGVFAGSGCSGSKREPAMHVRLTLESGVRSVCVKLEARPTSGETKQTAPMLVNGRSMLDVAVYRDSLTETIRLLARGYSDAQCSTPTTAPEERSDEVEATFTDDGHIVPVSLTLKKLPFIDADEDGASPPADCDDQDRNVHPRAVETCADNRDNDCNGTTDCADTACAGRTCQTSGVCSNGACTETSCNDGFDDDGDQSIDCADGDCAQHPCGMSGACSGGICVAPSEKMLCADGADNDGDGARDCADSDCAGDSCSDGDLCTSGERCTGGVCPTGTAMLCSSPPTACNAMSGQCVLGACHYPVLDGGSCSDTSNCTIQDLCLADGGCAGVPVQCTTPPNSQCFGSAGSCLEADGGCQYTLKPTATSCDDLDSCTLSDACSVSGLCVGSVVSCTSGTQCRPWSSTCEADGGCIYRSAPALTACADGGVCDGTGTCVGIQEFDYSPSNFDVEEVPSVDAGAIFNVGCEVIIDTEGPTISSTCGVTLPPHALVRRSDAPDLVLFAARSLTVASGAALIITGPRPAAVAVLGNASISGRITAESGAGTGISCVEGAGRDGSNVTGSLHGGGGGGAFGTNGANGGESNSSNLTGYSGLEFGDPELIPLRGGCSGGFGGNFASSGGRGGGAFQLSVAGTLTVSGTIAARGQRGKGAPKPNNGGGGGGSGGAILLEGALVTIAESARLTANGGAGGEGSSPGNDGASGSDGSTTSSNQAMGGSGGTLCGGDGGKGGSGAGSPTKGGDGDYGFCSNTGGGGGGGGGVGRIRINSRTRCTISAGAVVSPPASKQCQ
jgi:hypothetical protein